jgi:uncharacterized peroxidase-related enzyme
MRYQFIYQLRGARSGGETMAFVETTPVREASGDVRALYEQAQSRVGYVPNYTKLFSLHPEVNAAWTGLLGAVRSRMETRRYELITLAAARGLRSSYCMLAHGSILREKFFSAAQLAGIARDYGAAPDLTPAEVAMMAYAEQIARDATRVTREDVDALRGHGFSEAEIFDIAASAAARCFFSKLLDALGAEPDAAYGELEEGLRRELVVGRAISAEPVERV